MTNKSQTHGTLSETNPTRRSVVAENSVKDKFHPLIDRALVHIGRRGFKREGEGGEGARRGLLHAWRELEPHATWNDDT